MRRDSIAAILGGTPKAAAAATRICERLDDYALPRATAEQLRAAGRLTARQASVLRGASALAAELAQPFRPGERFANSRDVFLRYRDRYCHAEKEHFVAVLLDAKNRVIREVLVSVGSLSSSVVMPREAFSPAVRDSAAGVLFMHNHCSGDPIPSSEDRACTRRLLRAGRILAIRVLDHIVIGHEDYFSFADAGLLLEADNGARGEATSS